jgi:hypothetical protein
MAYFKVFNGFLEGTVENTTNMYITAYFRAQIRTLNLPNMRYYTKTFD